MTTDLLMINTDPIPVKQFYPDHSISLWWKDKTRRLNRKPRKEYTTSSGACVSALLADMSGESSDEDTAEVLQQWDDWTDSVITKSFIQFN